jgi:hypothetical protein
MHDDDETRGCNNQSEIKYICREQSTVLQKVLQCAMYTPIFYCSLQTLAATIGSMWGNYVQTLRDVLRLAGQICATFAA